MAHIPSAALAALLLAPLATAQFVVTGSSKAEGWERRSDGPADVVHVDATASGTGTSWASAFVDLQTALAQTDEGEIRRASTTPATARRW